MVTNTKKQREFRMLREINQKKWQVRIREEMMMLFLIKKEIKITKILKVKKKKIKVKN